MMTVQINYASRSPREATCQVRGRSNARATKAGWPVVIIIVIVTWAILVGASPTAPLLAAAAALAPAVEELVRAGLRHQLR